MTCSARDRTPTDVMHEPTVIFEVLSESTSAYDRGEKFWADRRLTSLQEYVLVDPERRRIEIFRRSAGGRGWTYEPVDEGLPLRLRSLDVELPWAQVFENVESAPPVP